MSVKLMTLPKGGRVYRMAFKVILTRYDLVAAVLYAWREGEKELTHESCLTYVKALLRDYGIEGVINVYNKGTADDRQRATRYVETIFPELIRSEPKLKLFTPPAEESAVTLKVAAV